MIRHVDNYDDLELYIKSLLYKSITFGKHTKDKLEESRKLGYIKSIEVEKIEDESSTPNVYLDVTYDTLTLLNEKSEETRRLIFFSSKGVDRWSIRMVNKVWDGYEPTTVAIDKDKKELYLVDFRGNGINFLLFQTLTDSDVETILNNYNDNAPFKFSLCEEAMFKYIDGEEGLRYLQEGVKVVFDCGIPVEISLKG